MSRDKKIWNKKTLAINFCNTISCVIDLLRWLYVVIFAKDKMCLESQIFYFIYAIREW